MNKIGKWEMEQYSAEIDYEEGRMNCRQVGPRAFQFIEVIDMESATGEKGGSKWCVALKYVDLDLLPSREVQSAIESCGWAGMDNAPRTLAEICCQYGLSAPLWNDDGPNRRKLLTEAYRIARESLPGTENFDEAMARPVNAIGSTAEEYMRGDIGSAMLRGTTREHELMRKLHGIEEHEVTFGTLLPPATPGGEAQLVGVRQIKQSDIGKCPFVIFSPDHYREDGTCKCNDPEHRAMMIREWGYTEEAFRKAGVIK